MVLISDSLSMVLISVSLLMVLISNSLPMTLYHWSLLVVGQEGGGGCCGLPRGAFTFDNVGPPL